MESINKTPIFADFNSRDEDDAVWLNANGTVQDLQEMGLNLTEGQTIWITDGEIEMMGTVTFRDDMWVAIPDEEGMKYVNEDAPYHIKNQKQ